MGRHGSRTDEIAVCVFSRLVGAASGERRFTRSVCVALAGAARVQLPRDVNSAEPLFDTVPQFGWPDSRTVLRRVGLSPEALSLTWLKEVNRDGTRARLPVELIEALFPPPVPAIAARLIELGPAATFERLEAFCRAEALRPAPITRARPGPARISAGTIDAILAAGRRFGRAVSAVASRTPGRTLGAWQWLPPPMTAVDLGALPACTDRSAPSVEHVATLLRELSFAIESAPAESQARRRLVRNRLLLGILAATGARVGALSRTVVSDYDPARTRQDGALGPSLRLRPGKTLPVQTERWKPLPSELGDWVEQHIAESRLGTAAPLFGRARDPGQPMNPDSLTKLLTADDPLALGRSAHTLRHLAEQLAYHAGRRRLARLDDPTPAQAYADALLDHAFSADPLGYKDIERRREELAGIATDFVWRRLRDPLTRADDDPEDSLRTERHKLLLRSDANRLPDSQILQLLLANARLSARIDDLDARRR